MQAVDLNKIKSDEAEAYTSRREIITVRIANNKIVEAKGIRSSNIAIRAIKDKRISIANATLYDDNVDRCIDNAIESLRVIDSKHEEWRGLPNPYKPKPFNGYDKKLAELSLDSLLEYAKSMLEHALEYYVDNVSGSIHLVKENIDIENTNGLMLNDKGTYIIASLTVYKDDSSGIGFIASRSFNIDLNKAADDACNMAINSINAKRCYDDSYSIIFEPYAIAELLAFVLAYNFNGKVYMDKRSCLYNKLEQKVAVDNFSMYDDPRIDDGLGSKAFDDEGIETRRIGLVEEGVFKNLIYDLLYGYKASRYSTGNGLRLGYPIGRSAESMPTISMNNIVVEQGDYNNDEIIKDTRKGLVVGRLWYTYPVNPEQGDFSCTARSGIFYVEDGEVRYPCKMVRIIDNIKKVLLNISAISKERKQVLQWHSIPCIVPMVRIDNIRAIPL